MLQIYVECNTEISVHTGSQLLVKFIKHNQKLLSKTWRFDLYQKKLVLSSTGPWHDGKTQCQESREKREPCHQVTVIDREPEHFTRWIKETIHIWKEGQQATNRDEGSHQLSHAYDRFLDHGVFPSCQEPEAPSTSFFW